MPEAHPDLHRLHASALVIRLSTNFRRAILGAWPVLITGRIGLVVVVWGALAVTATLSEFLRFRYGVQDHTLVVQGGILFRWHREIPFARVQSVEAVQRIWHRIFGVVELRVEAIGAGGTQAELVALRPEEAERLRRVIHEGGEGGEDGEGRETPEAGAEATPPLAQLGPRDLVLYGITGGRVAVLAALIGNIHQVLPTDLDDTVQAIPVRSVVVVVTAVVVGVLLVAALVSVALTVLAFWEFTLRRDGDRLVVTRGLLERRRYVVSPDRVQVVELRENLMRRMLGLASLAVRVAGQAGSDVERTSVLLPIARREVVLRIAAEALGAPLAERELDRAPVSALHRRLVGAVFLTLAGTAAATVPWGAWGLLGLLAGPPLLLRGVLAWRGLGHALGPTHLVTRAGALERVTTCVAVGRIQALHLRTGPTQRPFGLASLEAPAAKGSAVAHDVAIPRGRRMFADLGARLVTGPRARSGP